MRLLLALFIQQLHLPVYPSTCSLQIPFMPILDFQAFVFTLPRLLATSLICSFSGKALAVPSWVTVCRPIVLSCDSQIKHFSISCNHMGVARCKPLPYGVESSGVGTLGVCHSQPRRMGSPPLSYMIPQVLHWHEGGGVPWMGAKGSTPHQGAQGQADGVQTDKRTVLVSENIQRDLWQ